MDPSHCQTSCVVLLFLMALTGTLGAPASGGHLRNTTHPHLGHMVPLQFDEKYLTPTTSGPALNNHSISPWVWNVTHDASLVFPVYEARCLLRGCRDSHGVEDLSLESRPIHSQMLLLRRVRARGEAGYHYRLEQRTVAVGCTCIRPAVLQQN